MTDARENQGQTEFRGSLIVPSETEPRQVSLRLDRDTNAVAIHFEGEIAGATQWNGSSLRVIDRLKYTEVVFMTTDLPEESVQMTWKLNAAYVDGSLVGVIVPKKNTQKVSGEKGFTLVRV